MTAKELLERMLEAGFTLKVSNKMLEVSEKKWIDDELEGLIIQHKNELIRLLSF